MKTNLLSTLKAVLATTTLLVAAVPAQADLLSNGGFEAAGPNFSATGSYCYLGIGNSLECGSVPGWTGYMQVIASNSGPWQDPSTNGGWTPAQGDRLAGLQNTSYMQQTVTLAEGRYLLSWLDSNRKNYGAGNSYEVRVDGDVIDTFATNPGDAWQARSVLFSVGYGDHLVRFQGLRASGDGTSFIDNLTLVDGNTPVPEPQSLALVTLALLGAGLARRRKAAR